MGNAAARRVNLGAAQALRGDLLAGDRLDHVRAGEEHRAVAGHDDEVGEGRRIHRAARAGAEDHRDLRDHARGHDIAHEDLAIGGQAAHPLLDARAAGIVQPDDRDATLQRQVLDAADLLRLHFGERAAEHGEVLGIHRHAAAVDLAEAGDDAVAGEALLVQAEIADLMRGQRAEFLERAVVEQQRQPLARGELATCMLLFDALAAAAQHGAAPHLAQHLQVVVRLARHRLAPVGLLLRLRHRLSRLPLRAARYRCGPSRVEPRPGCLRVSPAEHLTGINCCESRHAKPRQPAPTTSAPSTTARWCAARRSSAPRRSRAWPASGAAPRPARRHAPAGPARRGRPG